jgi:hypothetical protein
MGRHLDGPRSLDQAERFRDKIRRRAAAAGSGFAYGEQFKLISKL